MKSDTCISEMEYPHVPPYDADGYPDWYRQAPNPTPVWTVPIDHPMAFTVTDSGNAIVTAERDIVAIEFPGTIAWHLASLCRPAGCAPALHTKPILMGDFVYVTMAGHGNSMVDGCGEALSLDEAPPVNVPNIATSSSGVASVLSIDGKERVVRTMHDKRAWTFAVDEHDTITAMKFDHDENLYLGTHGGHVIALDTAGKVRWDRNTKDHLVSTVLVDETGLYVAVDGGIVALDPSSGAVRWEYALPQTGPYPAPTLSGGELSIATSRGLTVLDTKGAFQWSFDGAFTTSPFVTPSATYVATATTVYALSSIGTPYWKLPVANAIALTVASGKLYVLTTTALIKFR
ncbi:MAG: PQQ-binding-like beta-propeller repeat protein [Kofleriaceae bacterium]